MNTFILLAVMCFDSNSLNCEVSIIDYNLTQEDCLSERLRYTERYHALHVGSVRFECELDINKTI